MAAAVGSINFFRIKGQNYEVLDSVIDTYLLRIGGGVQGG